MDLLRLTLCMYFAWFLFTGRSLNLCKKLLCAFAIPPPFLQRTYACTPSDVDGERKKGRISIWILRLGQKFPPPRSVNLPHFYLFPLHYFLAYFSSLLSCFFGFNAIISLRRFPELLHTNLFLVRHFTRELFFFSAHSFHSFIFPAVP